MKRSLATAVLALAAMTPVGAAAQTDEVGIPLGTVPAAVTLETLDGEPVELASWVGKRPVLLEFWAAWCELCEALLPRMEAAHRRYGDRVEFLAVAVGVNQTPRSVRRHLERHPMPFTTLWDGEGAAVRAYRAPATSYIVVLDAGGRVAYTGVGAEQDVEAAVGRVVGR